ncbi:MAG: hypothetical protein SGJ10_13850 [Bacteroidota bacterium]|nr:hypothetical protein [Bacteroidota bacterium]
MKKLYALISTITLLQWCNAQNTYTMHYNTMTVYVTKPTPFVPSSYRPFVLPQYNPTPNKAGSTFNSAASYSRQPTESEKAIDGMKKAFSEKNYILTINLAAKVEEIAKGIAYNEYLIGSYEKLEQYNKIAIEAYQRDIKFNEIKLYNTVAYALTINGLYTKASKYFADGKAYEFKNTDHDIIFWRSYNCLNMGEYTPALSGYDFLISAGYKDITVYYLRAEIYIRMYTNTKTKSKGLLDAAIEDLNKSMELTANKVDAIGMRAKAKYLLGDYANCAADINEQLKTDTLIPSWVLLAKCKMFLKDYKGSMDEYNAIIAKYPNTYEGYNGRGYIKCLQKDYDGGLEDITKAVDLSKDRSESVPKYVYENLAYARYLLGDYNLALIYLNTATGFDHNSFMSYFLRANCILNGGTNEYITTATSKINAKEYACDDLYKTYEVMTSENPDFSLKNVDELITSNCDILKGWEVLKNRKYDFSILLPSGVKNPKNYYRNGEYFEAFEDNSGRFTIGIQKNKLSLEENASNYKSYYKSVSEKTKFAGCDAYKFKYFSVDTGYEVVLFQKDGLFFIIESTGGACKSNSFFNSFTFDK